MNLSDAVAQSLLVVDDEQWINEALKELLEDAGYKVIATTSPYVGLDLARQSKPDALILDLSLPGMNGLELLAQFRASLTIPVMILSAHLDEATKVKAFELGADDYVCKPFGTAELVARVGALLRRRQPAMSPTHIKVADLELDMLHRRVRLAGRELSLTRKEFEILACLIEKPGEVFPPEAILTRAWGPGFGHYVQTLRVHIGHLRQKLGSGDYIRTVNGFGYSLGSPH